MNISKKSRMFLTVYGYLIREGSHLGTGRKVKQEVQSTWGYVEISHHTPRATWKWWLFKQALICQPSYPWSGKREAHPVQQGGHG